MMSFALNAGVGRPWVGAASNKFGKGKTHAVIFKDSYCILVYIYCILYYCMMQRHHITGGFLCCDLCCLMVLWDQTVLLNRLGIMVLYNALVESLFTRQVSMKGQHTVLNFAQACLFVHVYTATIYFDTSTIYSNLIRFPWVGSYIFLGELEIHRHELSPNVPK